jgi:ribosome-associated protein
MTQIKTIHRHKSSLELALHCARTALDKKAEDVVVLDVHRISSFADYFIIMSGRSTRHVQGLAEAITAELSSKRITAATSEGLKEGHWVLLDYDDVIVHIFYSETRTFYNLEGLWHDAPRVEVEETGKSEDRGPRTED